MIDHPALKHATRQAEPAELLAAGLEMVGRGAAAIAQQKPPAPQVRRRVSVAKAAEVLGCSPGWLYHNKAELPFVRRLGKKVVVDLAAAEAYMDAGHGGR